MFKDFESKFRDKNGKLGDNKYPINIWTINNDYKRRFESHDLGCK
jgi:hypothetical protein